MARHTTSKGKSPRAPGKARVMAKLYTITSSPEPPATTPATTQRRKAQSTTASRVKAESPDSVASPVRDLSRGPAKGAQRTSQEVEGTFGDPGMAGPPADGGHEPENPMRLLARLEQQMKDSEADTVQAVLDDLRGPIQKSVRVHSLRRLLADLQNEGDEFMNILRDECRPFVWLELREELKHEMKAREEAEFDRQLEQELAKLAGQDAEIDGQRKKKLAELDAELDGRREQKLAELAELDAQIERKSAVSTAPPVAVKNEQDNQTSGAVRIKKEADDEPLFLDWGDQGHQNAESRELKDAGHSGTQSDTVPGPFSVYDHDEPVDLPDEKHVPSIHEDGGHNSGNPLATKRTVESADTDGDDSSTGHELTIGDLRRIERRAMSLPSDSDADDLQYLAETIGTGESRELSSKYRGQEDDTYTGQEDVGSDLLFERLGESTEEFHQAVHTSSDQEHVKPGESSNHIRLAGDTYTGAGWQAAGSRAFPIDIDNLYASDDADDKRRPTKTRKSSAARGSKRKARTAFDDATDHAENGQLKLVKTEDGEMKKVRNFEGLAGDEKKVNETQLTVSSRKTDAVQIGRAKKPMPKRISRGSLTCGPQVKLEKQEEEDEEL
ncbi:MAG: hypothetical protein Q9195_000524 [Heterodermia aff. obscurata]